ncbi:hypothetical protein ERJ70_03910 [Sediminibacillus dalangtanensis]|uniref:Spore germination B3/ GerAC like, C-terminal n=1 Tax=Sediminibacillus dalangtanensis TaxID=2729421 RepID=A0ABX7VRU3_9BACI|nr:hypothetical protein [Sediminibacillus dalangtanensis]QTM98515.1 hypothetical protein ERJ70_03910 [Sediminibacillus dalangtanensis]
MKPFRSLKKKLKEQKRKHEAVTNMTSLQDNIAYFVDAFHHSDDIKLRILEEKDLTKEAKAITGSEFRGARYWTKTASVSPKDLEKLDWNKAYADIEINPTITFEIQSHGITN